MGLLSSGFLGLGEGGGGQMFWDLGFCLVARGLCEAVKDYDPLTTDTACRVLKNTFRSGPLGLWLLCLFAMNLKFYSEARDDLVLWPL